MRTKILWGIFIAVFLSAALFLFVEEHKKTKGEHCEKSERTNQYECPKYDLANFIRIKIVYSLNHNEGATIGLATIVLACVTLGLAIYTAKLWGSTERLMLGAEDTAQRQLRAYLHVERAYVTPAKDMNFPCPIKGVVVVINAGQTPAYKAKMWCGTVGGDKGGPFLGSPSGSMEDHSLGVIPPKGKRVFHIETPGPLTREQYAEIESGAKLLYVYGGILYKDAFTVDRETDYRFMLLPDGCALGALGALAECKDGNDAT